MAVSKWAGGIVILVAFIIAGKAQAVELTGSNALESNNTIVVQQFSNRK